MIELPLPYQHVLVVGLGETGWSAVKFLISHQARVTVLDTRQSPPFLESARALAESSDVTIVLEALSDTWETERWTSIDAIVLSPGIDPRQPFFVAAAAQGVPIIGDVELALQLVQPKVIAITGSNGKSTVTDWVAYVLDQIGYPVVACGNLGVPLLSLIVRDCDPKILEKVWVIELSSFQLESLKSLQAEVAVCLNVEADHLDRYRDIDEYARVKHRIYDGAHQAVINRDLPKNLRTDISQPEQNTWSFGEKSDSEGIHDFYLAEQEGHVCLMLSGKPLLAVSELGIYGRHNQLNALAVLAILDAYGVDLTAAIAPLKNYRGLQHRCQRVGCYDGVHWFNDSKATNVGAVIAAIEGLCDASTGQLILLLGGVAKENGGYEALVDPILNYVSTVVLFGQDKAFLNQLFQPVADDRLAIVEADGLLDAVQQARELAKPEDAVVLSPACASFDEFKNYQERGDQFMQWVKEGI